MERPNFVPILAKKDYIERTNSKPIETFIPNQAMNLKELVQRFERGQRLNVHENFRPGSNFTQDKIYQEDFEDAPPDGVYDVTDVHDYYENHRAHKADFEQRRKDKKKKEKEVTTPTPPPDPTPLDPSK